jgi:hypothetical protein
MVSVNAEAVLPYAKYKGHFRAGSFEAALSRLIEALLESKHVRIWF